MALSQAERQRQSRLAKKMRAEGKSEEEIIAAKEAAKAEMEASKAEINHRILQHEEDIKWAKEFDATGAFYKSECRPLIELLEIYEGQVGSTDEYDEDEDEEPTPKKKQPAPNPSKEKIRIQAVEAVVDYKVVFTNGLKEYRNLFEVDHVLPFREWLEYRDKARKDMFWLCGLLGKPMFSNAHKMVCDHFVQKNFDGMYFPGYTRDDFGDMMTRQVRVDENGVPTRWMMLFAPRGGRKSTIDGIDAVQWMLNAPDARILIVTAFRDLAKQLFGEIKKYFFLAPHAEPTAFQLLFPEYVLTGVAGRSPTTPVKCPAARLFSKEPHLYVSSMESSVTGQRADICKFDDAVDPKNSADELLRASLVDKFNTVLDALMEWSFRDVIGTRYYTDDYYGTRMLPNSENELEPFSLLSISAWYPKPEHAVKYAELLNTQNGMFKVTEDMVDLWWPEKLSFKSLRSKLREKGERSFKNQQLNIATDPTEETDFVVHFEKQVLRDHTYQKLAAPESGELIVAIDWAYSESRAADWTVLAACRRHIRADGSQELIVLDVELGKWKSSDVASHIVLFLKKHKPNITLIEKALGWDMLWGYMKQSAQRYGCFEDLRNIVWQETGNKSNEKTNRIKCLEVLLRDSRLHFVAGPWLDELYKQFERFTGETKMGRKDDIPDAIARAAKRLPSDMFEPTPAPTPDDEEAQERAEQKALNKAYQQRMFGDTGIGGTIQHPGPPSEQAPTMQEWRTGRRKDNTPVVITEEPQKPLDPRMRVFGNRGPWRL